MNWLATASAAQQAVFRVVEIFVRRTFSLSRSDPERELPGAELAGSEQQEAVRREASRRTSKER